MYDRLSTFHLTSRKNEAGSKKRSIPRIKGRKKLKNLIVKFFGNVWLINKMFNFDFKFYFKFRYDLPLSLNLSLFYFIIIKKGKIVQTLKNFC